MADVSFTFLSRRSVLTGLAAGAFSPLAPSAFGKPVADVEILCAPTVASIVVARLFDAGALAPVLPEASFHLWHDTDELRAATVANRSKLFTTPTHVPANLANRGLPLKLLAVLGMGHLTIVSSDHTIASLADLAGKPVLGFFRNDMPDLVFRAVAHMEGLDPDKDFKLTYVGTPMEAAQMLAAGRAETAILSEPPATVAIMMAAHQGRELFRAFNLQDIWIKHKGGDGIPMVGLGVHESLIEAAPELVPLLRDGLPQAKDWVFANRPEAAALAEKLMHYHQPMFLGALDHSQIKIMSAKAARAGLEDFYKVIIALQPAALDGHLPDASFYLDL
ncbi:ABC transporter substrate-binding protein [Methyloferula stellata]|uniref:ABC transporter substrate-binding protein n=1 Tax=Methyloferula stellata TaxID=876270 RepID=UPI000363E977|nr:ABC transporter substrate-binding protein [Methyloferula stellata]